MYYFYVLRILEEKKNPKHIWYMNNKKWLLWQLRTRFLIYAYLHIDSVVHTLICRINDTDTMALWPTPETCVLITHMQLRFIFSFYMVDIFTEIFVELSPFLRHVWYLHMWSYLLCIYISLFVFALFFYLFYRTRHPDVHVQWCKNNSIKFVITNRNRNIEK